MRIIINIGLARDGNTNIGPATALRELAASGFEIISSNVQHSDTELTLVALVEAGPHGDSLAVNGTINFLARLLGQDCVACYWPEANVGKLIGPKAAEWGEFDPSFFILLDGNRLSGALVA